MFIGRHLKIYISAVPVFESLTFSLTLFPA